MNKLWWSAALLLAGTLLPTQAAADDNAREGYRETMKSLQRARIGESQPVSRNLHVFKLAEELWVHRSYFDLEDQRVHANGMLLIGTETITIIDAPWTPSASRDLLDWLDSHYAGRPLRLVITHAHDDRVGGIEPFAERLVPVYSQQATARKAREQGWTAPNFVFDANLPLRSGNRAVELFFPGPAHSADNILVWFPEEQVLFGGCMVKSRHASSLGYLGDADRQHWPQALRQALARYPDVRQVVPGHGLPGDTDLIEHTLELLD